MDGSWAIVILLSFCLDLPPLSPLLFPLLYYLSPFPLKNYMEGSHTYTGLTKEFRAVLHRISHHNDILTVLRHAHQKFKVS